MMENVNMGFPLHVSLADISSCVLLLSVSFAHFKFTLCFVSFLCRTLCQSAAI